MNSKTLPVVVQPQVTKADSAQLIRTPHFLKGHEMGMKGAKKSDNPYNLSRRTGKGIQWLLGFELAYKKNSKNTRKIHRI